MADNFQIKKTNFLSIIEGDISRSGILEKWIRFLNEGSIVHFALTHSVSLNHSLLKQVFLSGTRATQGHLLGLSFKFQQRTVFLSETDLNTALHLPTEDFAEYPTDEDLLGFFAWIQCSLDENNMIPRVIYQNHLPKEWHLFFTILSHAFAPKISGFHGISKLIQIIGFSVATNRRINYGHLIMEEIIKNHHSVRENYMLYPRFLQMALDLKLTDAQKERYARSRLIEPPVLSLRPAMVLLNNQHYPNAINPARITDHIRQFFISLGLVVEAEQVAAGEEEDEDEDGDDQGTDSQTAQSESVAPDQAGATSLPKSPVNPEIQRGEEGEAENVPEQQSSVQPTGTNLTFDLSDFFGSDYLAFLDSTETTSLPMSEPPVAILPGNELGNPPVLTTAEEQQTLSIFTPLPLKRQLLYVSERVNLKDPKPEWFNHCVVDETALPPSKKRKLDLEASVLQISIQSPEPNTEPILVSEDELTEKQGGDTDSNLPIITLSKVSSSPGSPTLVPQGDVPRSDLSGEVRQLSGNSSSDESDRVYHTLSPSQGHEGNVGSPLPNITLPTSPLPEGTFPAPEQEVPPTKGDGGRQVLGKSSSDEPSTIFLAGTPAATKGMSVSDTPTVSLSDHPTPQTQTPSERAPSDTQTEHKSETPLNIQTLNLDQYVTKEKFDAEISKRDREISALKSRLTLAEVNVQMTQAALQAIQKQLAALSTPPIKSIKDSSTEGEKKTEEKGAQTEAEEVVEVKAQEAIVAVTQGESSFSTHLEEGEIDEPYVPEYVEGIHTAEEFTADEAQVDEEDEFADEYAFHDDCLLIGVKEIITADIRVAQDLLKRKLERVKRAIERRERQKDVIKKEGPLWDEARTLFKKKELTLEKNEDRVILDYIRSLRSQLPDIHKFYEVFSDQVTNVSVSAQKSGWRMYINFKDSGSKLLSTKSFKKLNIVELYVLMRKVIKGGARINELMRSFIEDKIKEIGVEAFQEPPVIKYYKPSTLHNMTLSDECLDQTHLQFMMYVEGQLRCKANRTKFDLEAAELLYAFRLNKAIKVDRSTLEKEPRYYLRPVYTVKDDGSEVLEEIADSKAHIRFKGQEPWFTFPKARGGLVKVPVESLKENNSESIFRALSMIKRSTFKADKLYLETIERIHRDKLNEEAVNNTSRVQGFPKRITVYMFSKKASLEFEGIKSINSTAYLTEMLKKLEDPPPVNALEVEARDLVKARLELITEELRQLRAERLRKAKESAKQVQVKKP